MPDMTQQFRSYAQQISDEIAAGEIEPEAAAEHIAEVMAAARAGDDEMVGMMIAAAVE